MCNCGQIETAFHYFFECPKYTISRNDLDLETGFVLILTLNIILNGYSSLSEQRNLALHSAVSKYIKHEPFYSIIRLCRDGLVVCISPLII